MGRSEDDIQQVCSLTDIQPGEEWINVPQALNCSISCVITLDRRCREQNPIAVNAEILALISDSSDETDVLIFTDGSVVRGHKSAWAFTACSAGRTIQEASMTMEVMAVTRAFMWLESHSYSHVCVLSDSMSMIRRVQAGTFRRQWIESLQNSTVRGVTFIFVPGHAGVAGNERTDRLAGSALITDSRPMDSTDIVNALREIGRLEDFGNSTSPSLLRIREFGVKIGTAKKERLTGRTRSLVELA